MNELRDKDGVGIYDCPEDRGPLPKSAAHEAALQDALNERDSIAYQSIGILRAMVAINDLPKDNRTRYTIFDICRDYDAINDKLVAILADKK